jgi:HK97 family phage major capsid protein
MTTRPHHQIRDELDAARAKRDRIVGEMNELHERAGGDTLRGGEATRWSNLVRGATRARADVERLETEWGDMIRTAYETGGGNGISFEPVEKPVEPFTYNRSRTIWDGRAATDVGEARDRALTALERTGDSMPDSTRENVVAAVENADRDQLGGVARWAEEAADPAYLRGFLKIAADPTGAQHMMTDDERKAVQRVNTYARAASLTDAGGGYLAPATLDPTVILTSSGSVNPFRQVANVKTSSTNVYNGVSSAGITVSWDTEGSEVSDDAPTFSQPSITLHKIAGFVPFSIEIGQDWPGLVAEMGRELADAKEQTEATAFATGTGTNQPTGIITALTGTASEYVMSTNSSMAVADLFGAQEALDSRWQPRAAWAMPLGITNTIRALATSNNYDFTTFLNESGPTKLLGKPLVEASTISSTLNTSTNYNFVYGDWSNYTIVDRVGTVFEVVPHLFATGNNRPSGQRGLYMHHRVGADSVNDGAFVVGTNPAV